jgi:histone-lysine N-methyltransferase SETMAR
MLTDENKASRVAMCQAMLSRDNFEVVPHASYSPDLAPSDFWLFPTLKDTLRGRTFSSRSALQQRFSSGHNEPLKKRLLRLQGDYVEK